MVLVVVLVVLVDRVVVHHMHTLLEEVQHPIQIKAIQVVLDHLLVVPQHMEQVAVVEPVVLVVLVQDPLLVMVEQVFNSHQHLEIQNQQLDSLDPVELTGLLVVVVERPMVPHQLLVEAEVLNREGLLHMQVQALVHLIQTQELLENLLKQIVDLVVEEQEVLQLSVVLADLVLS
tara:strand:+ start:873 stop:1397 length:525 start_codon:yes stop_codon:yes gene_type:complete